jgi:nucleoside-diphosphate-sugar epimerase
VSVETLLITGATGFVGSHVVEAIAGRATHLRALTRTTSRREKLEQHGIESVLGSLEDAESVRRAVEGADVVVHMAAALRAANEADFARVNQQGTEAVVEAIRNARKPPRRLVYLSSLAAVGPARDGRPVGPKDEPAPLTAYGRTKLAGERICRRVPPDTEVVILRATVVYGPGDRDLYDFFRLAKRGFLPVPTGPVRPLQLLHAADLARAVVLAATGNGKPGVYHIAEPRAHSWAEVVTLVGRAVGREGHLVPVPAPLISVAGAISEAFSRLTGRPSIFSRDKARELLAPGWLCETDGAKRGLGFEAQIALEPGLSSTAEWYRAQGWL